MPAKWKLPKELLTSVLNSRDGLRDFIEEERGAYEEMSDRWKDGDRAATVDYWLESLEEIADSMDCLQGSAF